jgi:hypothetical protein
MIWQSELLMGSFDVLEIGFAAFIVWRYLTALNRLQRSISGSGLWVLGSVLFGIFYATDLATMAILPFLTGDARAMALVT